MASESCTLNYQQDDDAHQQISCSNETYQSVLQVLQATHGHKCIPSCLLYDAKRTELYERILSEVSDYYLYAAETELFKHHSADIAAFIPDDTIVVELGCGTATKSVYILNALQMLHGRCQFIGIDVSGTALKQAEENILENVKEINSSDLHFIEDEYMEAMKKAKIKFPHKRFCIVWIGSTVGNLEDKEATTFMKEILDIVGPNCLFFLATDLWKEEDTLYRAYCDDKGLSAELPKNGMKNALALLGHNATQDEQNSWLYRVDINRKLRRVEMWVVFPESLSLEKHGVHIRPGEGVLMGCSRKFTIRDVEELAAKSGFYIQKAWRNQIYSCQMLYSGVEAFESCWDDTDAIFDIISDWMERPIDLRHPFLFYHGHLCAFNKVRLFKHEEVTEMDAMFSRDIDPNVLDPTKCHDHPTPHPEWPSRECVEAYTNNIRSKIRILVEGGRVSIYQISMLLEHERMHQETLAYMMAQKTKADFERQHVAKQDDRESLQNGKRNVAKPIAPDVLIMPGSVTMGSEKSDNVFVWDNELPTVEMVVSNPFMVSSRPVSVREYIAFMEDSGYNKEELWDSYDFEYFKANGFQCPATWSNIGGEYYVHDHNSSKHWTLVADRPVYVSLAEAEAYCKWAGNYRLMTEAEYHRALSQDGKGVHDLRKGGWEWTSTPFQEFPGFKPMVEYVNYSIDFFDGQHYVLKGSSPATHPALIRDSFRNFYQRQYRYMFAKFRCVISCMSQKGSVNVNDVAHAGGNDVAFENDTKNHDTLQNTEQKLGALCSGENKN